MKLTDNEFSKALDEADKAFFETVTDYRIFARELIERYNRQKAEIERLQEYEKGIKENKFVEMPCKVGQKVYYIFQFSNKQILPFVRTGKVRKIYCKNNKMDFTVDVELTDAKEKGIMRSWSFSDFGSKIFTNQKQADFWCSNYENLVKEMVGEDNA